MTLVTLVCFGVSGWVGCAADFDRADSSRVVTLAASSVAIAMEQAGERFERESPGASVVIAGGPSNALASQLLNGAPGDVFVSANPKWATMIEQSGLAKRSIAWLSNRLVIVVPSDGETTVRSIEDLRDSSIRRIALAGDGVPLGEYARQALRRAGVWDQLESSGKIVQGTTARVTLAYAERGEVDAAIVYRSDATNSERVRIAMTIDRKWHDPIIYQAVLIEPRRRADENVLARRFFDYLQSVESRELFRRHGFELVDREGADPSRADADEEGQGRGDSNHSVADGPAPREDADRDDVPRRGRYLGLTLAEWQAVGLSLWVGLVAVVASLPLGIGLGWLFSRGSFPGKSMVEAIVNLPLVLPPVVTGYLLLVMFGRQGIVGGWLESTFGVRFVFDWKGAALAAAVVSFPLMMRSIRSAFSSVDRRLEQAARTLGARPFDAFWTISLPLARRGVIAGCVLAFARSLGEFGATIMIAGNIPGQTRTIPLYVFNQLETPGGFESATGIVVASVLVSTAAVLIGNALEKRGQESQG